MRWTFYGFVQENGRPILDDWLENEPVVSAKFKTRLRHLRDLPAGQWRRPYFDSLESCGKLKEIRFKARRVQWRPIGFFGIERECFSIVVIASERGSKFDPPGYCEIGMERQQLAQSSPETRLKLYELD